MRGRSALLGPYHWPRAAQDLAMGVHPAVVAARLGEHVETVLDTADSQGWPVLWKGPTPDRIITAAAKLLEDGRTEQ